MLPNELDDAEKYGTMDSSLIRDLTKASGSPPGVLAHFHENMGEIYSCR